MITVGGADGVKTDVGVRVDVGVSASSLVGIEEGNNVLAGSEAVEGGTGLFLIVAEGSLGVVGGDWQALIAASTRSTIPIHSLYSALLG